MCHRLILYCGIIAVAFASCVSKKKYVELESRKKKSDQRVVSLKKELSSTQKELKNRTAEFDKIREDLEYSNVQMLSKVDEVSEKMTKKAQENQKLSGELEDQLYSYKNENRQLSDKIGSLDKKLDRYKEQLTLLKKDLEAKSSELIEVKYALNNEKDKLSLLNQKVNTNDDKVKTLKDQSAKLSKTVASLKGQIVKKNEEIERLKNNVKLLKKQI